MPPLDERLDVEDGEREERENASATQLSSFEGRERAGGEEAAEPMTSNADDTKTEEEEQQVAKTAASFDAQPKGCAAFSFQDTSTMWFLSSKKDEPLPNEEASITEVENSDAESKEGEIKATEERTSDSIINGTESTTVKNTDNNPEQGKDEDAEETTSEAIVNAIASLVLKETPQSCLIDNTPHRAHSFRKIVTKWITRPKKTKSVTTIKEVESETNPEKEPKQPIAAKTTREDSDEYDPLLELISGSIDDSNKSNIKSGATAVCGSWQDNFTGCIQLWNSGYPNNPNKNSTEDPNKATGDDTVVDVDKANNNNSEQQFDATCSVLLPWWIRKLNPEMAAKDDVMASK
jgi:hypothetical protein